MTYKTYVLDFFKTKAWKDDLFNRGGQELLSEEAWNKEKEIEAAVEADKATVAQCLENQRSIAAQEWIQAAKNKRIHNR